ncbi:MAG: hypothetical protein CM15mP59_3190 [Flavobacteriaceae bacterium]|nr:MAG: hypothetical protein CM15mP59_3190 [Flavobacteriaceae bacterium]
MAPPKIHIKTISAETTHIVRHPVLRYGLPKESCALPGDDLPTTIHLGAYSQHVLIGVCTVLNNPKDGPFTVPNGQIRGWQCCPKPKQWCWSIAVEEAERLGKTLNFEVMWMNARKGFCGFIHRFGYKIDGALFDVPIFGPHYRMKKSIL